MDLDPKATAIRTVDEQQIVTLHGRLHDMDKQQQKYSPKNKKRTLEGGWRASRKRTEAEPGQQATGRFVYLVIGRI